jgi:hypothetical protein
MQTKLRDENGKWKGCPFLSIVFSAGKNVNSL